MIPLPPKLSDYRAETKLIAGNGISTVWPDIDFETYSPAGFEWDGSKFKGPAGSSKKGLFAVGMVRYVEHPDAEVLSLAYNLKDGSGPQLWVPNKITSVNFPTELIEYVLEEGGILEAWNSSFEFYVWNHICVKKYGFPYLRPEQLRCAMAKSRAFGLPGSLESAGNVLNIANKKDKGGKRLLDKFSIPRSPTLKDPRTRILPSEDPEDAQRLYDYNLKDIEAESEISSLVPDLIPSEQEFWLVDQVINFRGVKVDIPSIRKCIEVLEQAYAKYNRDLSETTDYQIASASEASKIIKWLAERGVYTDTLREEDVDELLARPDLTPDVRKVLLIRSLISGSAVKKLYAMLNMASAKDRLHNLFVYHSARTGRAAGAGVQPQNFPNSGPDLSQCSTCNKYFKDQWGCPWCGQIDYHRPTVGWEEHGMHAVEQALETLNTGSLPCVEHFWGDGLEIISGCLRSLIVAEEGHDLICSDYSAIEAVVLAMLAGEEWRIEVFKTHGKIYETSASKITGTPLEEYLDYKKRTGSHHIDRKLGKVSELACFTHDTLVLTDKGYLPIMDVGINDKLWDGEQWVDHQGVIRKGVKEVIDLDGIEVTPDHPISLNGSWREAKLLALNENMLTQALEQGSASLPILEKIKKEVKKEIGLLDAGVRAENILRRLIAILGLEDQEDAIYALKKPPLQQILSGLKNIKSMDILYPILNIDEDLEIVYQRLSVVATMLGILLTETTGKEELKFAISGEEKNTSSLRTLLQSPDGITRYLRWIELIATVIMSPKTSDLLAVQITNLIKEKYKKCKTELNILKNVYDIVNAGPRNRFTIKTNSGHLIVHNSGYQGWIGAWKKFKADQFMTEEEIKKAILAWRAASPEIVEMWGGQKKRWQDCLYGLEGMAIAAVMNPGTEYHYRLISYLMKSDILYCKLPSGRTINYHRPRLAPSERKPGTLSLSYEGWNTNQKYGGSGWTRMDTYGGKLTENVVQAVARDILAHAIVNLEKKGYPIVLHVHDEIVAEVPEGFGSIEEFEQIMSTLPDWAHGWPVKASGGWRRKRYGK